MRNEINRETIVELLIRLNLPAQFVPSKDPEVEDDQFIFNSKFSLSFNEGYALLIVSVEDDQFLSWTSTSIITLESQIHIAAHYMYAVQGDDTFKNLVPSEIPTHA